MDHLGNSSPAEPMISGVCPSNFSRGPHDALQGKNLAKSNLAEKAMFLIGSVGLTNFYQVPAGPVLGEKYSPWTLVEKDM